MGQTGTEVSKEAAAMILTDDNFATIVGAVAQGRVLYMNILKAIQFLLSSNLAKCCSSSSPRCSIWHAASAHTHLVGEPDYRLPARTGFGHGARRARCDGPSPRDPRSPIFTRPLLLRVIYQA